ncbi:hypothetical protein H9X83_02020 [Anaerotignum lactatifermentans]|uniref:Uncharacterized protein n=1 Tax=Anaerotignum lactatifermentans TaxID=160404 RepID=A0ABS2G662_9FIRM|nr:hypothetical protein [Anaerotignum lactatifermentans]
MDCGGSHKKEGQQLKKAGTYFLIRRNQGGNRRFLPKNDGHEMGQPIYRNRKMYYNKMM